MVKPYFTKSIVPYINYSKLLILWQLIEHLQAYYAKWKWNVNRKNSVAHVVMKV
jgi:hypothetical protein